MVLVELIIVAALVALVLIPVQIADVAAYVFFDTGFLPRGTHVFVSAYLGTVALVIAVDLLLVNSGIALLAPAVYLFFGLWMYRTSYRLYQQGGLGVEVE